jgi:fibronectin type 3 domain-containing protein
VDFKLPDGLGDEMDVTMARGTPFTWTRWQGGLNPRIEIPGTTTVYDVNNNAITTGTSFTTGAFSFNYQGAGYGIFLPPNTPVVVTSGYIEPQLSGSNNYMVVGYLPSTSYLSSFASVAYARPTNTQISWSLDSADGLVDTTWTITTAPLQGSNLNTIQGWLPHHYRTTTNNLSFTPYTYLTPRGTMRCTVGNSFQINFPFKGILPILPAPVATGTTNDFQPSRMLNFLSEFNPGTMLGDTYWSGKAMALCAQNMAWASQMQDTTDFLRLRSALEAAMENWLTYTPGETNGYFAWYQNFHAMVGWDASYGTQAFNDLHFHYGYFAVTGAILGMYDQQFLANYGPMLKLLVKCYGNWDRTDASEPFLRMFDVWEGHSNAGGTSSPAGENQESSSEATQSWAGMYLLGSALNDSAMTAAGAMGFSMETAADNEYWEDLWQTNFPSVYGRGYAGQVYSGSYNYGTFFSGDPGWVYGIQYTPSNSWNNYLVRYQEPTAASKFEGMYNERAEWCASQLQWTSTGTYPSGQWVQYDNSIYAVSGTAPVSGSSGAPAVDTNDWSEQANCSSPTPDILGAGLDHVILAFQGLWDFNNAAAEFDQYYAAGEDIATNTTDAGCTYYMIHSSRCLGNQDYNYTTSIPTSAVYLNPATGVRTFAAYNPQTTTAPAIVYNNGVVTGTMTIPGMALVSSTNPNYVPTVPQAPTGLQAVAGYGSVTLTWNPAAGATSYNVKRATISGGPYTTIGTAVAASFLDNSVSSGNTYFYVVSAVNSVGEGANSTEAETSVTGAPVVAINCGGAAVSPFVADVDSSGGTESNTATTVNIGAAVSPAPEAVYQTYRFGNFTYTLTGLTPGASYIARLHFSEDYWGAKNKRVFNVALSGTQVLTNFDIFAAAGANYTAVVEQYPVTSSSAGQITAKFTTVTDNAACCGIEIRTVAPSAPTGLVATSGTGQIALGWAALSGATSYNVKRATVSGGPYSVIANPSGDTFTDSTVSPGVNYYYVVSALNGGGESGNSGAVSGASLLSPLQQWRQSYFGTINASDPTAGNLAAPMGDGIPNLMKYALGLNPYLSDAAGLPQASFAGGLLSITFRRMANATDITYHVQGSADLNSWTEIWNSAGVPFGGGTNSLQQVTISDTGGPQAGRRFLRLEVTQP